MPLSPLVRCFPTVFYLSNPFKPCIYQFRTALLLLLRKGLRQEKFNIYFSRKQSREGMWGRKVASESQSVTQTAVDLSIASQLRIGPKHSNLSEVNSVIPGVLSIFYLIKNIKTTIKRIKYWTNTEIIIIKKNMNHQSLGPIICYSLLFSLYVWWPC